MTKYSTNLSGLCDSCSVEEVFVHTIREDMGPSERRERDLCCVYWNCGDTNKRQEHGIGMVFTAINFLLTAIGAPVNECRCKWRLTYLGDQVKRRGPI